MIAGVDLAFHGHSAVAIDLDRIRIPTDRVGRGRIGPLPSVEPVPARDRLTGVDAVFISHLHSSVERGSSR